MKPLRPFRPEPPPPRIGMWAAVVAVVLTTLGIGFALYGFHDAGAISAEAFLVIMVFVVALAAGVIMAMDMERQVQGEAGTHFDGTHFDEVQPPFDLHTVWPPPRDGKGKRRGGERRSRPGAKDRP